MLVEAKVYRALQGFFGIPKLLYAGTEGDHNGLVMELLGPSIEYLKQKCNGHFTVGTVLCLAEQMVLL